VSEERRERLTLARESLRVLTGVRCGQNVTYGSGRPPVTTVVRDADSQDDGDIVQALSAR